MAIPGVIKIAWAENDPRADPARVAGDDRASALEGVEIVWATGPAPQGEAGRRLVQEVLLSLGCEAVAYVPVERGPVRPSTRSRPRGRWVWGVISGFLKNWRLPKGRSYTHGSFEGSGS